MKKMLCQMKKMLCQIEKMLCQIEKMLCQACHLNKNTFMNLNKFIFFKNVIYTY